MSSLLIFVEDLLEAYEHYRRAFNAQNLGQAYGDQGELIHLEMEFLGHSIALSPHAAHEITKGNVVAIYVKFRDRAALLAAFDVLKECGQSDGLAELPWSPLEGYVTDKYGVVWCIGLYG